MKLVILDRDGVINEDSDAYIKTPDEWIPLPGSLEAIGKLCREGFTVVVASNQSGLARGYFDKKTLEAMHNKMQSLLSRHCGKIDRFYICPHGPNDNCLCRKPNPGLLKEISRDYRIDLIQTPVIGDSLRDLQAAEHVGALPILVLTGKGKKTYHQQTLPPNSHVYNNLSQAVDALLSRKSSR